MEAVILAGGLGTRLRSVVSDRPKSMAEICGRPFLSFIFDQLIRSDFKRVILAVGYKNDVLRDFYGSHYQGLELEYSEEKEPLGTGGAIRLALEKCQNPEVFVLNGDIFFDIEFKRMLWAYKASNVSVSLALKNMKDCSRYGFVELNSQSLIKSFLEKQPGKSGLINGGVYLLKRSVILSLDLGEKFSIEHDFFTPFCQTMPMLGIPFEGYFIDIGIPEDYERAQSELLTLIGNETCIRS